LSRWIQKATLGFLTRASRAGLLRGGRRDDEPVFHPCQFAVAIQKPDATRCIGTDPINISIVPCCFDRNGMEFSSAVAGQTPRLMSDPNCAFRIFKQGGHVGLCNSGVLLLSKTVKRTPSNRARTAARAQP